MAALCLRDLYLYGADGRRSFRYFGFLFFVKACLPLACWWPEINARRDYLYPQVGVPDLLAARSVLYTLAAAILAPVG